MGIRLDLSSYEDRDLSGWPQPGVPHPGYEAAEFVDVTPEMANFWVKCRYRTNRKVSKIAVRMYMQDIENGRWPLTGEALIFDWDGYLIDGQHRLIAQAKAGSTMRHLVVTGIDPEAQEYIDLGRARTAADQLKLAAEEKSGEKASIANLEIGYSNNSLASGSSTVPERVQYVRDHSAEMVEAARLGRLIEKNLGGGPRSVYGVVALHFLRVDPEFAELFVNLLGTPEKLNPGDPILALRTRLMHRAPREFGSMHGGARLITTFHRVWNAWIQGEKLAKVIIVQDPSSRIELDSPYEG